MIPDPDEVPVALLHHHDGCTCLACVLRGELLRGIAHTDQTLGNGGGGGCACSPTRRPHHHHHLSDEDFEEAQGLLAWEEYGE